MNQYSTSAEAASRFFTDQGIDGVLIHDEGGKFLDVNEAVCRTLLYSRSELLSLCFQDIHSGRQDQDPSQIAIGDSFLVKDAERRETIFRRKDGKLLPVELKCHRVTRFEANVFVTLVRDISERKRREEAFHEAVSDWQAAFDVVSECVFTLDAERAIRRCNKATLLFLGKQAADVVGRKCYDAISGISQPHDNCPVERMLVTRKREVSELSLNGGWFECVAEPIYDSNAKLRSVVHVLRDISDRKRMEEERLVLSKLESTGILAGGLAHDFNNLLAVVIGNLEIAEEIAQEFPKILPFLKSAEKAVWGARDLTSRLITFARGGVVVIKPTSLNGILQKSVAEALKDSQVECEITGLDNLPLVPMDEHQMNQVFANILQNSREAIADTGKITVSAEAVIVTPTQKIPVTPGKYVRITISDKGKGISSEILPRIFDPYFSTKDRGSQKGMGLGLTICHSIIHKHHGAMTVDSQIDIGTAFHVYLPVASSPLIKNVSGIAEPVPGGSRLLVMEDEESIREILINAVNTLGFAIQVAEDGSQAVEMYAQALRDKKPFNLVLLDLTVPGRMGGKEALDEMRKLDPAVKAIVSSGYAKDPVIVNFAQHGFLDALIKPYRLKHLKEVLGKFLTKKP